MFGDIDMRARMNRLGGFDWGGHKRHGFPETDNFFKNDFHQFPGFNNPLDAFNRAKTSAHQERKPAQSAHHIGSPGVGNDRSQFYDHVPEEFRQYFPESFGHSFGRMRNQQPQQTAAQSPPNSYHQPQPRVVHQHQQTAAHPAEFVYPNQNVAPPPRPKVCDAAIQTDILTDHNPNQENVQPNDRSQSVEQQHQQQTPNMSSPYENPDGLHNNIGTSMTPQSATANQSQFNYPQQHAAQPQFAESQVPPQSPGNRERTVPIVVEGRSSQRPASAPRPEPFVAKAEPEQPQDTTDGTVPQTPHTTDCITKIQNIQTDVLDLMSAVDQFNGMRGDKDYMFIDEMLTRNLLKLDTIDTNGRESIRLARKEAIRCIQASITVLEAKAEQNANKKKAAEQPKPAESVVPDAETKTLDQDASASVQPQADDGNIEQSLEERLADFQRKSEERDVANNTSAATTPVTHVSQVNINLNGS